MTRRELLKLAGAAAAPAIIAADRPRIPYGVQCGDVLADRATIWSRADRPSRLMVEYSTTEGFQKAVRVVGPHALPATDFTARIDLTELPPGQQILYRVQFVDLADGKTLSEPVAGRFRTPALALRDVSFIWSGDTCGQGWGINPEWGGMRMYETMRREQPDFFLHSGDTIYADNPVLPEVRLPDGSIWRNLTTPEKSKVAETLDEYRGNYRYNLLDENLRRFNGEVPQVWQWDDHEVMNNWSPGKDIAAADPRYAERSINLLAAYGTRAFLEYAPMRFDGSDGERIYRRIPYGPLLDLFVLDMRSYRGANTFNRQSAPGEDTAYLGRRQLDWLKRELRASRATWKVIAADMPLGLVVGDGKDDHGRPRYEASANGDGPPLGRELEIAELLRSLKRNRVRNTVWITADTHYTSAHYYDPAKAQFTDFDPFWEFVSGPIHAGTFGPNEADNTFGPRVMFFKAPPPGQANLPPSAGYQFYGKVRIEARTQALTVDLKDLSGAKLYSTTLVPHSAR